MANIDPSQRRMFRLTVTTRTGHMRRDAHKSLDSRRPGNWLQRLGVVAVGLVFLPVALFSFAVFVGLFLTIAAAVVVYGLFLQSRFKRMQARHVVESKVVSDDDGQKTLLETTQEQR